MQHDLVVPIPHLWNCSPCQRATSISGYNNVTFHNEEDKLKEILIIDQLIDRAVDE